MKQSTGLLFLFSLLLLLESSCSGSPSQRALVEFPQKDASPIRCHEPPTDVIVKGGKASLELTAKRLGTLLQGTGGVGLDIERIRQELPPEVSAFEVIEFRICAQYGNGALSKEEYHAFTEQIIPAYTKNPPAKTGSTSGNTTSAQLVDACGPSFTTKRPAAKFVPYWASLVSQLREERNSQYHDLQNFIQIRGRIPVDAAGIDPYEEISFTLDCLEKIGYVRMEKTDPPIMITLGGKQVDNQKIVYLRSKMTIPE